MLWDEMAGIRETVLLVCLIVGGCGGVRQRLPEIAWLRSGDLYLSPAGGGEPRHCTKIEPGWDRYLAWSPDGKQLLYACHDAGWNVWVYDPVAGSQRRLTEPGDNRVPAWSRDGRRIAFMSGIGGLSVMEADGSGARVLTSKGHRDAPPSWSPDGSRIAFEHIDEGRQEVWVIGADGSGERRRREFAGSPAYSPHGATIACAGSSGGKRALLLLEPDRDEARVLYLAEGDRWVGAPSWSPDGGSICFECDGAILVVAAAGGDARRVATVSGRGDILGWSPRGDWILCTDGERGAERLLAVPVAGGTPLPVADGRITVAAARP